MKTPSFFVGYPGAWIKKRPWLHEDNIHLYKNIKSVLDEYGYRYEFGDAESAPGGFDIVLSHHTRISRNNLWNLKKGYLPGFSYWDRSGYSGWAELANSESLFLESQKTKASEAMEFYRIFSRDYIRKGASKFPQRPIPGMLTNIPAASSEFSPPSRKFVFVACQRPGDTVSALARVDTMALAESVVHAFRDTEYSVVIKVHPQANEFDVSHLALEPHVSISQNSIHEIIPHSMAVITVNSGVGFEALLHGKPVYTSGHSDYHWVSRRLTDVQSVCEIRKSLGDPVDDVRVAKFIYYCLNNYFVNSFDRNSVRNKIDRCCLEWREQPNSGEQREERGECN